MTGEISSQLHGGYHHAVSRGWQAERQLTKVSIHDQIVIGIEIIKNQN